MISTRVRRSLLAAPALVLAATAAQADIVAFDMVGSTSQNLVSFSNPWNGAFSSLGDGFQRYQRNVSATIPFNVLDDSISVFTGDTLGIIDENNTDEFFGVTDTQNSNNSGPVSASWVFDISGFADLSLALDIGAMGDFEDDAGGGIEDFFDWSYSIDGGATTSLFRSFVDEDGTQSYTLSSGTLVNLNDPMLLDGIALSNLLQTFSGSLAGAGSLLTLTLTAQTDGPEAMAFQNLVISGTAVVPEPATLALVALGLLGIGAARRRR